MFPLLFLITFRACFILEYDANIQKISPMQEKKQNISPVKQRILLFAESLGISKRDFYLKIGVSRGTLESKTGITEDILAKFIATYPDISIVWLLTGEGSMLRSESTAPMVPIATDKESFYKELIEKKDKEIAELNRELGRAEERLLQFQNDLGQQAAADEESKVGSAAPTMREMHGITIPPGKLKEMRNQKPKHE